MKNTKVVKFLKKNIFVVWIIAVSFLLSTVVFVYAAYESSNYKIKRVVAPAAASGNLFTSNYLSTGTTTIRSAYFNDDEVITYNVVIRNYNPADRGTVFEGDIPYTLHAVLAHSDGTAYDATVDSVALGDMITNSRSITINMGNETLTLDGEHLSANSNTHTLSGTGEDGENEWTVVCNNIPLNSDYCLKLMAEPAGATNLGSISATIIASSYPVVNLEGWSCYLVESGTLAAYDAFNYTITGTGTKTLKFSYDSTKLTVNESNYIFFTEIAAPVPYSGNVTHSDSGNWRTIVISADPENTKMNRYDLQVYKVGSWQPISFDEITPGESGAFVEFEQN
ncbi:hypothetical protein [Ruminococcus sp.]|uniref:hypothetical protein n=1 Tax=Ruminococcus sp. TaxID=41978 RepID=UPI00258C6A4A|nr:hypothetical protein [Ruminococcus sp.]MCR5020627.1 hypothetical protein [Ruminococcus sp.]